MERKISLSDLQKAVYDAFEQFKEDKEGQVDSRLEGVDTKMFGISVMLTDGTVIDKGNVDVPSAMGSIVKIPTHLMLNQQMSTQEILKKGGYCTNPRIEKPKIPVSSRGIRAVSMIEPYNDPDGKWDLMINNIINMMGSAPVLDDKLYEKVMAEVSAANTIDTLANDNYYLYDQAEIAVNLYVRLLCMQATAKQLAVMGATVAADGRNPLTGEYAFDGSLSASAVAMMAVKGPHRSSAGWLIRTGLPAKSGFGGGILGILPGVGAFAAYSPLLNERGVSIRGAKALAYIMNTLQLNAFSSARAEIVK